MNFAKIFFFVVSCFLALAAVSAAPEPRWKPLRKLEKLGQRVRDGVIKVGPAVSVISDAQGVLKQG
ncbi:hyphancin-3F-like [Hyposmocoma kahamanoa]|uniref:hyphancin-3F-like n=1 Tax=Hyposmocoma kahamanoa TaxID=1477025 RepID=UPI000E6DA13D|nr:hyphancin-3F-like [Hyposmocoma kahamanoa]